MNDFECRGTAEADNRSTAHARHMATVATIHGILDGQGLDYRHARQVARVQALASVIMFDDRKGHGVILETYEHTGTQTLRLVDHRLHEVEGEWFKRDSSDDSGCSRHAAKMLHRWIGDTDRWMRIQEMSDDVVDGCLHGREGIRRMDMCWHGGDAAEFAYFWLEGFALTLMAKHEAKESPYDEENYLDGRECDHLRDLVRIGLLNAYDPVRHAARGVAYSPSNTWAIL